MRKIRGPVPPDGTARDGCRDPRCIEGGNGIETWHFQDVKSTSVGLNAVVTWPKEEWGLEPSTFAEMRPGAYDVHERVRDMNHNGILSSMCFASTSPPSAVFLARGADGNAPLKPPKGA